jgi:glycosidase
MPHMKNHIHPLRSAVFFALTVSGLGGCATVSGDAPVATTAEDLYGTDNRFASEAIYFLLTDRFVDGDPSNNQIDQGKPEFKTFDRHLPGPDGKHDNIGYLGGDFKGILDNASYIADMGFTAIWTTPIIDNPDAAYSGSEPVQYGSGYLDGGKTGYHGYWGVNFYRVDEHLPSEDLDFRQFVSALKDKHGLKYVLDIVGNHGSPSYTMPVAQSEYGKLYDESGKLVADHQNLKPEQLDPSNPLHRFFNRKPGLATLSDLDPDDPAVVDYLVGSYLKWLDQGAYAIRVDTIKEQPHRFWKRVADRIREKHPDIFMFGESFSFEAKFIAEHTKPENGGYSVLDFPGRESMIKTFENPSSDYRDIAGYLHLETGVYQNPYELVTFYDNHDMSRMNATDAGFIDANNWLFTSRGIPAVYYGSETGFMRGTAEHFGNRNYFGQERVDSAKSHPIRQRMMEIANIRKENVSLQKGLQLNLRFAGQIASFYRIYQRGGVNQTALVMLNKGGEPTSVSLNSMLEPGQWRDAFDGEPVAIAPGQRSFSAEVPAHGIRVFFKDAPLSSKAILERARRLMRNRSAR